MAAITLSGNSVFVDDATPFSIVCNTAYPQITGTSSVKIIANISGETLYSFAYGDVTIEGVTPTSQNDALEKISVLLSNNHT